MALTPGSRIGPYEIIAAIGAGGMGEVYRARDTKLDRDVALKILPESFANDPDRLMRFEREAKTLALLNHPNIAHIHGLEEANGVRALVMELVEGEDLSERIRANVERRSSDVEVIEWAVSVARQIIDALEAAHEAGIVHRDLKPANIKVRTDGTVKVLDFGLAKAMSAGSEESGVRSNVANSPTMTSPALTAMGLILGTAAYMSPEQAKGRPVDKRADIWAFGAVLYEMLTGQRAFQGDDVSDLLVAVLSKDVDLQALPAKTPIGVATLIRRCLERDPKKRLRDIGDARLLLDDTRMESAGGATASGAAPAASSPWMRTAVIALAAVATLSLAYAAWVRFSPAATGRSIYLSIPLPAGHALISGPAISRNGEVLAFVSSDGVARPQLYIRRLDEPQSRLIAGTEDADDPFFSPDGRFVGFYAKNQLFKVSLAGGAPVHLADSNSHNGGTWMDDGRVVFHRTWNGGLYVVSENGGPDTVLIEPKRPQEYAYAWPLAMPGSHELIFSRWGDTFTLQRLDLRTMTQTTIGDGWRKSAYATSGYLVFGSDTDAGELWAFPDTGAAKAPARVTVAERVDVGDMSGDTHFDLSDAGTLVYSGVDRRRRMLAVVDVFGRATPTGAGEGGYAAFSLSPDGRRVAARAGGGLGVVDLERTTVTPLVPELKQGAQSSPIWADNGRVIFGSNHEGNWEIYAKSASGAGAIEPILRRALDQDPLSLSPDGTLLFLEEGPATGADLWMLPKGGKPEPWLATSAQETDARFSPDGHFVAYVSNTSNRAEVYVQPRTGAGNRVQVSVDGGNTPVWAPGSDRLYFRKNNFMMVATINIRGTLSAGPPEKLFDGGWPLAGELDFALRPDGKSFLMIQKAPEAIPTRIDLVLNWFGELARRTSR